MMKGRIHDAVNGDEEIAGDTHFICVDRQNIMFTTFQEFESIEDFHLTFEKTHESLFQCDNDLKYFIPAFSRSSSIYNQFN